MRQRVTGPDKYPHTQTTTRELNNDSSKTEHKREDWINSHDSKAVWEQCRHQLLVDFNESFLTSENTIIMEENRKTHPNFESKLLSFLIST